VNIPIGWSCVPTSHNTVIVIYFYDRWILKPEKMKRKFVVIVAIQSVLMLLTLLFAIVQKAEADKQREVAEMQMQEAITHRVIAEGLRAELDAARSDCGK